jgi:hypothetical protein
MDESQIIGLMVGLFGLTYAGQWLLYQKINSFSTTLKILCREHQEHHGGKELEP